MIRLLDVLLSLLGLLIGAPLFVTLMILVWFDGGEPIFRQVRVGRNQERFVLLKFRTMNLDAPSIATHKIDASVVTPLGLYLRKFKLDELPQLWNVLCGHMSLVGPRPCLPDQQALIAEREALGVFRVRPGITGLSQIRKIDMSTPELLAKTDAEMLRVFKIHSYFRYIFSTIAGEGFGDRLHDKKKEVGG